MKLRNGVAVQVAVLLAVALVLLGLFVEAQTRHGLEAQVDERASGALRQRLRNLDEPPPRGSTPGADGYPPTATLIFDASGRLLERRYSGVGAERDPLPDVDLAWARRHLARTGTIRSTDGSVRFRAASAQIDDGRTIVEAAPLRSADASVRRLRRTLLFGGVAVLLVAGVALAAVIGRSLRPLSHVADTAGLIAAGDLRRRVGAGSRYRELRQLGTALDAMVDELTSAVDDRTRALETEAASRERLRRFAADASHELQTPITSIRGWAELYRIGGLADPRGLGNALSHIERDATRMGRLVDDLLLLAKAGETRPGRREPCNLTLVCQDAVMSARNIDRDRTVTLTSPACTAVVLGDPDQLRQVVDNLLANVRAHTPPGTRATVTTAVADTTVRVVVADDGPGFPPDGIDHVFERAWQAPGRTDTAGGHGLGLAIAHTIVHAHSGTLTAANTQPHGACVTLTLPRHVPPIGAP